MNVWGWGETLKKKKTNLDMQQKLILLSELTTPPLYLAQIWKSLNDANFKKFIHKSILKLI